ncbi:helix-turn-helix domain-containing protein [Spirosoma sp. KNUC1025]|uniref:winged helix-turn-helix transcriptional regulator n=1 Tax=Spirosoma sp. KNUC1025 TaxID=2894082 RepID=UPI003862DC3A|nr:helix-turn-helix transcriptional regulator [Spirosoma sp. KNUC1025]
MAKERKNKDFNPNHCPVTHCLNRIGGKWKIMIIYAISRSSNRFSSLQRAMPDISKQMLVNQLRELEEDKIIERIIYAEIPPRVEYKITEYGQSLFPIINVMQEWGIHDMKSERTERMEIVKN